MCSFIWKKRDGKKKATVSAAIVDGSNSDDADDASVFLASLRDCTK